MLHIFEEAFEDGSSAYGSPTDKKNVSDTEVLSSQNAGPRISTYGLVPVDWSMPTPMPVQVSFK